MLPFTLGDIGEEEEEIELEPIEIPVPERVPAEPATT